MLDSLIMKKKLLMFTLGFIFALKVFALPSTVIIIRHGEKPTSGPEGRELSETGWKRAFALPQLFSKDTLLAQRGLPDFLIATKPSSSGGSIRSIQTLQPLSKDLAKPIQAEFTKDEIPQLIKTIMNSPEMNNKVVMIAWQHDSIPEIALGLGARMAPKTWPSEVFDRYWLLDFKNNKLFQFQNLPQRLLKKDSKN